MDTKERERIAQLYDEATEPHQVIEWALEYGRSLLQALAEVEAERDEWKRISSSFQTERNKVLDAALQYQADLALLLRGR